MQRVNTTAVRVGTTAVRVDKIDAPRYACPLYADRVLTRCSRRTWTRALAPIAALFLTACGSTVSMYGTADEVWGDTVEVLRMQGAMPAQIQAGLERPRVDRVAGEIDLPYAESVYYGEGAAFLQVDLSEPLATRKRSIRMWVDYPVGMKVVRFGRAINDETTRVFKASFEENLDKLLRTREAAISESTGETAVGPTSTSVQPNADAAQTETPSTATLPGASEESQP